MVSPLSSPGPAVFTVPGQGEGAAERWPRYGKGHHSSPYCPLQHRLVSGPLVEEVQWCKICLRELGGTQEPLTVSVPELGFFLV